MKKRFCTIFILLIVAFNVNAQTTLAECSGTAMPYKAIELGALNYYPDSLTPFFINHLGRHGARYSTSAKDYDKVITILNNAKRVNGLTPCGENILLSVKEIKDAINGKWGLLTPLGVVEQEGIAERLINRFPKLIDSLSNIIAISTQVPRCIASMNAFTTQIQQQIKNVAINKSNGIQYNNILRFFDVNNNYIDYKNNGKWKEIYEDYISQIIDPYLLIKRVFVSTYNINSTDKKSLYMSLINIAQILPLSEIDNNFDAILSYDDNLNYWKTQNLRQYLAKSASVVGGDLPIIIAKPLMEQFICVADSVINGDLKIAAYFRFAHAETLIPFVALMRIDSTYAPLAIYQDVYKEWKDYNIAPMAANVQWVFYKGESNEIYVQILLNENPVELVNFPANAYKIYKWGAMRNYLNNCIGN